MLESSHRKHPYRVAGSVVRVHGMDADAPAGRVGLAHGIGGSHRVKLGGRTYRGGSCARVASRLSVHQLDCRAARRQSSGADTCGGAQSPSAGAVGKVMRGGGSCASGSGGGSPELCAGRRRSWRRMVRCRISARTCWRWCAPYSRLNRLYRWLNHDRMRSLMDGARKVDFRSSALPIGVTE